MKKGKINAKITKKIALFTLLGLLVVVLGYSIIKSYTNKKQITSQSIIESDVVVNDVIVNGNPKSVNLGPKISIGNYLTYIKSLDELGIPKGEMDAIDLYDGSNVSNNYLHRFAALVGATEGINIAINGNDGVVTGSDEAIKNWPDGDVNGLAKAKYGSYLQGDTGYYMSEDGTLTYNVNVAKTGLYFIKINYFIPEGKGSNPQRSLIINGQTLFSELASLSFYRLYTDDVSQETLDKGLLFRQDINDNDIKPSQKEVFEYRETYVQDPTGYVYQPYYIYLKEGNNTIAFESIRDNLVITKLEICSPVDYEMLVYADYIAKIKQEKNVNENSATNVLEKLEVEDPRIRVSSSPTLYPISDRTSATNNPSHPVKTKYNAVGGSKWSTPGDYMSWKIEVPTDGLYKIAFRTKQDLARGLFATRRFLVDGVQPFNEAANCRFYYDSNYSITTIGDNDGNPYFIYLTAGAHTISLQATLGEYGEAISSVQDVVDKLNALYLKIIAITTANPDDYADYNLYPYGSSRCRLDVDMQKIFSDCAIQLNDVSKYITELTGEKSSLNNVLDKLVLQIGGKVDANGDGVLEDVGGFATKPRNVTKDLSTFKSNLSSLGTWILDIQKQSLTIESLFVYTDDKTSDLPRACDNFFQSLWFKTRGFVQSFWFDYESIGVTDPKGFDREIEVWFLTSADSGREQANVIKSLIDQNFIYDTTNYKNVECNVILKVLAAGVLLPATLAGTGPDVAINVDGGLPVNYALRNAIYDISSFPDFEETWQARYTAAEMVPYYLTDKTGHRGCYGMPNTVSYLVMFYRTDIFADNGWEIPQTWDDVINLVTELQVSNLSFYLPLEGAGSQIYATLLYQMGGQFYTDDYTACDFSTEVAKKAFEQWCSYFSDYSFEKAASFSNRFRSGEMPIGIASFTLYNTLSVFAPDIAGKWDFAQIPGTPRIAEDGTPYIDHRGALGTTASVIMKKAKDPEMSWAFLKFWTDTVTQKSFATEIESILGSGARHNTANIYAMQQIAWSNKELSKLIPAFEEAFGVPEVPGGYYIGRNLENSIREVINNDSNPRETLEEYVELINGEITRKRTEFGLPTASK